MRSTPRSSKRWPDDLQADRQAVGVVSGAERCRRLLRHVERRGEGDVLERLFRIVTWRRLGRRISGDRRGRRDQEIVGRGRRDRLLADLHDEGEASRGIGGGEPLRPPAPRDDERQYLRALVRRQELDLGPQPRLEEAVEPRHHLRRHERRDRLDDRAGAFERCGCGLDRGPHRRLRLRADADVEHEAELDAGDVGVERAATRSSRAAAP